MDAAVMFGTMAPVMTVNGSRTRSMELAITSGQMVASTTECGRTITCTEEVSIPGRMVVNTRVNISTTASMASASTHGKMADNMKDFGTTENNTAKESTAKQTVLRDAVVGKKAKGWPGWKTRGWTTRIEARLPAIILTSNLKT